MSDHVMPRETFLFTQTADLSLSSYPWLVAIRVTEKAKSGDQSRTHLFRIPGDLPDTNGGMTVVVGDWAEHAFVELYAEAPDA